MESEQKLRSELLALKRPRLDISPKNIQDLRKEDEFYETSLLNGYTYKEQEVTKNGSISLLEILDNNDAVFIDTSILNYSLGGVEFNIINSLCDSRSLLEVSDELLHFSSKVNKTYEDIFREHNAFIVQGQIKEIEDKQRIARSNFDYFNRRDINYADDRDKINEKVRVKKELLSDYLFSLDNLIKAARRSVYFAEDNGCIERATNVLRPFAVKHRLIKQENWKKSLKDSDKKSDEIDFRIATTALYAAQCGNKRIAVVTNDRDIVNVSAVALAALESTNYLERDSYSLWSLGEGGDYRKRIGVDKSREGIFLDEGCMKVIKKIEGKK